jgi:hypothetical protein
MRADPAGFGQGLPIGGGILDLVSEPSSPKPEPGSSEPKLFAAWLAALQAELMLGHLAAAGPSWPEANLFCHACITSLRSVTAMVQKALRHEPGFEDWYSEAQDRLREDPEFVFLKNARNYVLKEGALQLMMSYSFGYSGPLGMKVKSVGPDGPDVIART